MLHLRRVTDRLRPRLKVKLYYPTQANTHTSVGLNGLRARRLSCSSSGAHGQNNTEYLNDSCEALESSLSIDGCRAAPSSPVFVDAPACCFLYQAIRRGSSI